MKKIFSIVSIFLFSLCAFTLGSIFLLCNDSASFKGRSDGVEAQATSYCVTFNPNGGELGTGYHTSEQWSFNGGNFVTLGRDYMYTNQIYISVDAYLSDWSKMANSEMRMLSCTEAGGWNVCEGYTGNIDFIIYDSGFGYKGAYSSKSWASVSSGWHNFELSFDGKNARGFLDGNLIATSETFESGRIGYNATNAIFVGAESGPWQDRAEQSGNIYFTGSTKNIKIYNTFKAKTVNYGYTYGTMPTPKRDGYTFVGWYTSATGGSKVTSSTTFTKTSNQTLYAGWAQNISMIVFDPTGGELGEGYSSTEQWDFNGKNFVTLGREYMYTDKIYVSVEAYSSNWRDVAYSEAKIVSCTHNGGWNIVNAYSGKITFDIHDGNIGYREVFTSVSMASLSAGWHKFELTFDGKYARGFLDGAHIGTSEPYQSGKIGYNPTNAIFIGVEAGDNQYSAEDPNKTYFKGSVRNLKIYNTFKAKTVDYNALYGALPTPHRKGYVFDGWYTASSGGSQVVSTTTFTGLGTTTLYAHWKPDYYVSFDENGGSYDGYTSSTELTFNGENFENLGRTYMYEDMIYVSVEANMDDWSKMANSEMRFLSCTDMGGWNVCEGYGGNVAFAIYDKGYGYKTIYSDIKWSDLSAGWHKFELSFDGKNAIGYLDGSNIATSENFESGRIGYNQNNSIFIGAEAGDTPSTPEFTDKSYFVGKIRNVKILHSCKQKIVNGSSVYGLLPSPTLKYYTFAGWYTQASGGTKVESSSTNKIASNHTLYARWAPVPITNNVYMRVISKDGKTTTDSNAGGSVSVQRNVISGEMSSASTTTQTSASVQYTVHQGQVFRLTALANSGYVLAGISTSTTTPNPSSPPSITASYYPTANTTYYVYFKQVSGNQLKYDSTDKYFYFEDGYYPQSRASVGSATANGETFTYNDGNSDVTIPVYTYNGERYVKIEKSGTSAWFKFEPIRWRISDYGVANTERNIARYTTLCKLANYTSYTTNFTAVSDLILSVGAMHNTRDVEAGFSVQDMASYQNIQNTTDGVSIDFNYKANTSIIVDKYSTVSNNNTITKTSVNYTAPLRIASLQEIKSVGLVNKQARASDMVAFLLGVDKNKVSYWTRDLSNLGSGTAITAGGTVVQPWLNQVLGIRFAYTFSEASNVDCIK